MNTNNVSESLFFLLEEQDEEIQNLESLLSAAKKRRTKLKTAIHLNKQQGVNSVLLRADTAEVNTKRKTYAQKLAAFTRR